MIEQFLGIKWIDEKPFMMINCIDKKDIYMKPLEGKIHLKKTKKKLCKGYFDLESQKYIGCRNNRELAESGYDQCLDCESKSNFKMCKMCNGDYCKTSQTIAREYCSQPHYIYLAYFEKDIVKVGTAAQSRKTERLLEQGAIYSIYIAKTPDGRLARKLEKMISQTGIKTRVLTSQKMKRLLPEKRGTQIFDILNIKCQEIRQMMPNSFLQYWIEPEINDYSDVIKEIRTSFQQPYSQMCLFSENMGDYSNYLLEEGDDIDGEILGAIGSVLVYEKKGKNYVKDSKEYIGWVVDISD